MYIFSVTAHWINVSGGFPPTTIILFLHIPYTPLSAEQPDPDVLRSHLQNHLK